MKIRVYLDNCTYNRPFDDQTQIKLSLEADAKRYIQLLILEKSIDLVCSYVNRFENNKNPQYANKKAINEFFHNAVLYIDYTLSDVVEKRAISIKQSGIKTVDAFHISCALEGNCNYFITTDKLLLKFTNKDIIICDPIQFLDYLWRNIKCVILPLLWKKESLFFLKALEFLKQNYSFLPY